MKRLAVLTGGGDCPGLNAVIRAIVKSSALKGIEVVGICDGFRGAVEGEFIPLDVKSVSGILPHGGTILGNTRSRHCWLSGVTEPCPLPQNFPLLAYHWWGFPKPSITM